MTPQHCQPRLTWQINSTAAGFEKDTNPHTQSLTYAAYTYLIVPFSKTHGTARRTDTETCPNAWHVSTARLMASFCQDEEESFHAWQFCPVRWEAEKIRRMIEVRHPRPFRTITFETQEPRNEGHLYNCRYLVYSLA